MLDLGTLLIKLKVDKGSTDTDLEGTKAKTEALGDANKKAAEDSKSLAAAQEDVTSALGKVVGAAAAGAAAVAASVAAIAKSSLDSYATYEQLEGGIRKLYGNSADEMLSYAQSAWKTAGMSSNEYLDMTTDLAASLIKSLNGDTTEAAKLTDLAIQDMADNASIFGTSMEDIQNAYKGFAKENYTMLDNLKLGYSGTKTGMEELLADAEQIAGRKFDIGNFNDVIEAIHVIQENQGIAGNSAAEALGTIEGSMNATKAAWSNFVMSLGDENANFEQLMDDLVVAGSAALSNLIPAVTRILDNIKEQFPQLWEKIKEQLPEGVQNIIGGIEALIPGVAGVLATITTLFAGLKIADTANKAVEGFSKLWKVLSANPILTVVALIAGLVAGFIALYNSNEDFRNAVDNLWQKVQPVFTMIGEIVGNVVSSIVQWFTDMQPTFESVAAIVGDVLGQAFQRLGQFMEDMRPVVERILGILGELATFLGGLLLSALETAGTVFQTVWSVVSAVVTPILGVLIGLFTTIADWLLTFIPAALDVLCSIWEAIWPVIQVVVETVWGIIQTVIETAMGVIQGIIDVVMAAINGDWEEVWNIISTAASDVWETIKSTVSGAIDWVKTWISDRLNEIKTFWGNAWQNVKDKAGEIWGNIKTSISDAINNVKTAISNKLEEIKTFWSNAWENVKTKVSDAWNNIKQGCSDGVNNVLQWFRDLPGKILSALGNLGNLLLDAGKNILSGFLDGLKQKWEDVKSFVGGIGDWIAANKGPKEYDLGLLVKNGGWIMQSLQTGLEESMPALKKTLDGIAAEISDYNFDVSATITQAEQLSLINNSNSSRQPEQMVENNITVNNYSPQALSEKQSAREFRQSMRRLAIA
jgi:phage-related protein